MSEHGQIARPYAQAAFELAQEAGELPAWAAMLSLAASIVSSPDVNRLLFMPGTDLARLALGIAAACRDRLGQQGPLAGGDDAPAANFLRLLAANGRLSSLPDIAERFARLKAEAENTIDVEVTTAAPVTEAQQAAIAGALKARFGRDIRLSVELDDTLIGGARIRVGDRIIDGSVRARLEKLASALTA